MSVAQRVQQPLVIQAQKTVVHCWGRLDNMFSKFPVLIDFEQRTQVPKTYAVLGALVLSVLFHTNMFAASVSNIVGWCLPAFFSLTAVEKPSLNVIPWLQYWVVFSFLGLLESFFLRLFLYYVPWYFSCKCLFCIWLQFRVLCPSSHLSVTPLPKLPQDGVTQSVIDHQDDVDVSEATAPDTKHPNPAPLGLVNWAYKTPEKNYFQSDTLFIKRNFVEDEWYVFKDGDKYVPYMCLERMRNEVAALRYVQQNTNIPTPNICCAFEDGGRFYLITEIVPGVTLGDLPADKRAGPIKEIEGYVAELQAIKSKSMGSISGDNSMPWHITATEDLTDARASRFLNLKFRDAPTPEFVFCHMDLGQHNIIVDEKTLRVRVILDWEYAGFYPPEFEGKFYLRPGPSVAHEGEEDDVPKLLELLEHWKA